MPLFAFPSFASGCSARARRKLPDPGTIKPLKHQFCGLMYWLSRCRILALYAQGLSREVGWRDTQHSNLLSCDMHVRNDFMVYK